MPSDPGLDEDLMKKATSGLHKGGKLHMHIHPSDDKKFIVQHTYHGGEPTQENSEHAPSTLEELLAHVKQHYSPTQE